jgi:ribonuclease VapC
LILASSSVVAVLMREREHELLLEKIAGAGPIGIGAPTLVQAVDVMVDAVGERGRGLVSQLVESLEVEIAPFDRRHSQIAIEAALRFGAGRHPAALGIDQCMTYAIARIAEEPLLYAGNDFARTDIEAA